MLKRLMFLITLLALLAGCAPAAPAPTPPLAGQAAPTLAPPPGTPTPDARTVITFGVENDGRNDYMHLAAAFEAENPGVRVQVVSLRNALSGVQGADARLRVVASSVDTALVFTGAVAVAVRPDLLLRDLTPLIDADPTFDKNDFYPGALHPGPTPGSTIAMQREIGARLLFYNKRLFEARGVAEPRPDWTWDDLFAAAEQLVQRDGDTITAYGFSGDYGGTTEAMAALFGNAGIDIASDPATLQISSPAGVLAVERLTALIRSGAVLNRPVGSGDGPDSATLASEGRLAMWTGGPPLSSSPSFPVGVAPLPPLTTPVFPNLQSYVMSAGTQQPELAWRWLHFLSQQELPLPGNSSGPEYATRLPARISVAERSYWPTLEEKTAIPGAAEAVRAALQTPPALGRLNAGTFGALEQALNNVLNGKNGPTEALASAQQQLPILAQLQRGSQANLNTAPVVVATPVPEAVPGTANIIFKMFLGEFAYQQLADEFSRQNPDIRITVERIEIGTSFITLADLAESADCFVTESWLPTTGAESLLDLQPLIDADASFNSSDIPAGLLAMLRENGRQYALPRQVYFPVLHYNQDAFDRAGVPYPRADWTLDDLVNTAQQLDQGEGSSRQYGFSSENMVEDMNFVLARSNASLTTGSGPNLKPNFTDPKVATALRFYLDLLKNHSPLTRLINPVYNQANFDLISSGRAAMWFDRSSTEGGRGSYPFKRGIAPPPLGTGILSPDDITLDGFAISGSSPHSEACWRWITFLSTNPASITSDNDNFAARVSLARNESLLRTMAPGAAEVYNAYSAALERTPPDNLQPLDPKNRITNYWFFRAVDRAMRGGDLDKELADAQFITEQYLACVRGGEAGDVCSKQVDPTADER